MAYQEVYDSIDIDLMRQDILDKFIYVMENKFKLDVQRNELKAYVYGNYNDTGSRNCACIWKIGWLSDNNYYAFSVLYDNEQNELYGRCTESIISDEDNVKFIEYDRIDTFLDEEGEREREQISEAFFDAIGVDTASVIQEEYTVKTFTSGWERAFEREWVISLVSVAGDAHHKDQYQFEGFIKGGTFRAECVMGGRSDGKKLFSAGQWIECEIN